MSIWTHVAGCIRIDDLTCFATMKHVKTDISKVFIRDTWHNRNENGNMPRGSEGSLDVEIIDRNEDGSEYMRVVTIWGDLRDYNKESCEKIKKWWYDIPQKLGKACEIRNAVLQVQSEDGADFILTEKNMNIIEENEE